MPTWPVMSGIGVMTSRTSVVRPLRDRREAQVAVGHHADELLVVADDRQARDAVLAADARRAPPGSRSGPMVIGLVIIPVWVRLTRSTW